MAASVTMSGLQFDALPYEEGRRWELLDGERIAVSSPTPARQRIVRELLRAIQAYLESGGPSEPPCLMWSSRFQTASVSGLTLPFCWARKR